MTSGRNGGLVASLGADRSIDYACEDFTGGDERYDLVFDTVGNRSVRDVRRVLAPDGAFVSTVFRTDLLAAPLRSARPRLRTMFARPNRTDLTTLARMLDAGSVVPVVDRVYPLEQAAAALGYLAGRRARGKIVLRP